MTTVNEIRKRYGIPKNVAVKTLEYNSIPTSNLLKRIDDLQAKIKKEFNDTTLEESLDINELSALQSELERRVEEKESVLALSNETASLMTPSRVRLLALLHIIQSAKSIKELAQKLGRPKKSVARDIKILEKHGLVITKDITDQQGKRREIRAGAQKLILAAPRTEDLK
ncbi:MAG: HTH domain-containing protein [Thaumarchaeota archaeon]|nr:HTH domain-containing protein [Nitrososphaerota archaeon]MCL5317677.1 HTH domain-containing protein [Nitrososphaerota archaeon]